jgi:hypothetical protein
MQTSVALPIEGEDAKQHAPISSRRRPVGLIAIAVIAIGSAGIAYLHPTVSAQPRTALRAGAVPVLSPVAIKPVSPVPVLATVEFGPVTVARPHDSAGGERPALSLVTGYPSGSADDQRILAYLKQANYEGGGTVVQNKVGCSHINGLASPQ